MNGWIPRTGLPHSSQTFILKLGNVRKIGPSVSILYQDSKKPQNLTVGSSNMCDNPRERQDVSVATIVCVCTCDHCVENMRLSMLLDECAIVL